MNDKENAEILYNHYQSIFNRKANVDPMILDEINQHTPSPELGITPSSEEN